MKTIVLTGVGSGGHIIPNIALLPYLKKHFDNIYYVGEKGGMENSGIGYAGESMDRGRGKTGGGIYSGSKKGHTYRWGIKE